MELRARERLELDLYDKVRKAAEVHRLIRKKKERSTVKRKITICNSHNTCELNNRQVRKFAQGSLRPGVILEDWCGDLEDMTRRLIEERGLEQGCGFPTGFMLLISSPNFHN